VDSSSSSWEGILLVVDVGRVSSHNGARSSFLFFLLQELELVSNPLSKLVYAYFDFPKGIFLLASYDENAVMEL
jgi:hypothetical protein